MASVVQTQSVWGVELSATIVWVIVKTVDRRGLKVSSGSVEETGSSRAGRGHECVAGAKSELDV